MEMRVNPGEGEKKGQRKVFLGLELPAEEPHISQEQACLSICPRQAQPGAGRSLWDVWPHDHASGLRAWHRGVRQSCSPTVGDWRACPWSPGPVVLSQPSSKLGPYQGKKPGESQQVSPPVGGGCRMGAQASLLA